MMWSDTSFLLANIQDNFNKLTYYAFRKVYFADLLCNKDVIYLAIKSGVFKLNSKSLLESDLHKR